MREAQRRVEPGVVATISNRCAGAGWREFDRVLPPRPSFLPRAQVALVCVQVADGAFGEPAFFVGAELKLERVDDSLRASRSWNAKTSSTSSYWSAHRWSSGRVDELKRMRSRFPRAARCLRGSIGRRARARSSRPWSSSLNTIDDVLEMTRALGTLGGGVTSSVAVGK